VFAAFDLLWVNGKELRNVPLLQRKMRLREIVRKHAARTLYVDHVTGFGKTLFAEICAREGVSSRSRRSARTDWFGVSRLG